MRALPKIGEWVFITGSRQITDEKWKQSYPQNIFGKVIGYETRMRCKYVMIRCYRKHRDYDKTRTRYHLRAEKKNIEIYKA